MSEQPDRVEEALLESFPASDPPAWTGAVGAPTEERSAAADEGDADEDVRGAGPQDGD